MFENVWLIKNYCKPIQNIVYVQPLRNRDTLCVLLFYNISYRSSYYINNYSILYQVLTQKCKKLFLFYPLDCSIHSKSVNDKNSY